MIHACLRYRFLFAVSCLLLLLPKDRTEGGTQLEHPNVVVILADDLGWGDLSCHGNSNLNTPHLDELQLSGASFERFYVEPVCSPTRAEFLTGRYALRDGVTGVTEGAERLDPSIATLAEAFQSAGYKTAIFGKWHNGTQAPYHPNSRGFNEFYGFTSGHWGLYFSPVLEQNNQLVPGEDYLPDEITNRAIEFIKRNHSQPFFLFVAFNTPHSPMQVPDLWWNRIQGKELLLKGSLPDQEHILHTRAALAMCENLDWNVGRLRSTLAEFCLLDDTVIVFFSDNGPNGHRWNGGMKGIKGSTDEGGVRVPLLVSWPAQIKPQTRILKNATAIDLAPTLVDLTGIRWEKNNPIDGISLHPLLLGASAAWPTRTIFSHWNGQTTARRDSFLLDSKHRLYDLTKDPFQSTDISSQNPDIVAELETAVSEWLQDVQFGVPRPPRPFVIGHPDSRITLLPARDANGHGTIRRSSKHPNCSYFTNWKSRSDVITWHVEVATPGEYRAEVYYTCSEQDKGSLIELRLGETFTQVRVADAFDPPLKSEKYNRFQTGESPVKDFAKLDMGIMLLSKETGELTLRALDIPGTSVMDFRMLVLTRLIGKTSASEK